MFKVSVEVKGDTKDFELEVQLAGPSGETLKTDTLKVDNKTGQISWEFHPGELELWWPWQLGSPALHTVTVTAKKVGNPHTPLTLQSGRSLDSHMTKTGVRRVRLIQEGLTDQPGKTWLFEINNVRVFLAGSNWIPADNIPTDITDQRYADWLDLLVEGGQNVVRIWGGGIYEPDVFYDLCDEKGILVMHDVRRLQTSAQYAKPCIVHVCLWAVPQSRSLCRERRERSEVSAQATPESPIYHLLGRQQ